MSIKVKIVLALLCLDFQLFAADIEDPPLHTWERFVRKFRRDHNTAVTAYTSRGRWSVNKLGALNDETYSSAGESVKFQYSFHLPIYKKFGYILGSSIGYHRENPSEKDGFRAADSVMFPGVLVGIVQNFSPPHRLIASFEIYMERFNGFAPQSSGSQTEISVTANTFDGSITYDYFFTINWGLRIDMHQRYSTYQKPRNSEGLPVDANLKRHDYLFGLGTVYHFL